MDATVRVKTSVFKNNPKPFVEEAKAGKTVIVTSGGSDDFQIVPVMFQGPPPVSDTPIPASQYKGINTDEPGFPAWS